MVIAIDGPAGSGKSTVARRLAARLDLPYLDTGAMYRGVTFAVLRRGVDPDDVERVAHVALECELQVDEDGTVTVDGVDATIEIRGPEVTRAVSIVAANPAVRDELRRRQREWAEAHDGGVVEGRDIGTVVFPDADLKLYITASARTRAERRVGEIGGDVAEVEAAINERDRRDMERLDGPLAAHQNAVVVDTTGLSVDEVVERVLELLPAERRMDA